MQRNIFLEHDNDYTVDQYASTYSTWVVLHNTTGNSNMQCTTIINSCFKFKSDQVTITFALMQKATLEIGIFIN